MRITKIFAQGWWPIKGAILALRRLKGLSVLLTEAFLKEGFTETEIRKIMGENVVAFYMRALP